MINIPVISHFTPVKHLSSLYINEEKELDLNDYLLKDHGTVFTHFATDHSMYEHGISKDDILIIAPLIICNPGDVVLAEIKGEKHLRKIHTSKEELFLMADSLLYPPVKLSEEAKILGKAIYNLHDQLGAFKKSSARKKPDLNKLLIKNPTTTSLIKVNGKGIAKNGIYDNDLLLIDRSFSRIKDKAVLVYIKEGFTHEYTSVSDDNLVFYPEEEQAPRPLEMDGKYWGVVTYSIHKL